ncbi:uncharacterized protein EV422DRAFT_196774 [Fimicolochytrium jonesii]|uniref:uncharacterized protein n=1 Tax=Fimicolochytrium jonesii TaxID=1396493 RepID=UPI0022FEC9F5|nr:uncharacterized protein EV422DRAFT_196774 [Fimicolochytrium jonesii]KAI8817897.1 hypothetical protein EV422DRAFT_196774 [Fimicolochytrium jonesii]
MRPIPPTATQSSPTRPASQVISSQQQQASSPQTASAQADDKAVSDAQVEEVALPPAKPPVWTYSPLQTTGTTQPATSQSGAPPKPQRLSSTDSKPQSSPQQNAPALTTTCSATCASTCAWKTKARDSVICLVHGSACTYSPSDVLASLQERVVELANTVSERDAEIATLKERIAELELIADRAETENEVNAAKAFARSAVKEMNEAGAAAGRISDDLKAANSASEGASSEAQPAPKVDKSVPVLERSGRSLAHATRARPSPRARKTSATPKDTTSQPGDSTRATAVPQPSDPTPLSQDGAASTHGSADSINSNPQEEFKKKIAMMGGVNPLMGMNPAMMVGQLKATGRLSKGER